MTDLENALIFDTRKGNRKKENKENSLYFSITKSKAGYKTMKFYIGSNIARKLKINDGTRLKFACDKEDFTIWYLIAGDTGFAVRKEKDGAAYSSSMSFPFRFIDKKMQQITDNNIEINSDKRILTFFVFNIFDKETLVLE